MAVFPEWITELLFQFHKGTIRTINQCSRSLHHHEFQFHKGTIRTVPFSVEAESRLNFNSIKVRLELLIVNKHFYLLSHFNSIKVRLEPLSRTVANQPSTFQFHKGTIRTNRNRPTVFLFRLFQFHKGTIRTRQLRSRECVNVISIP